MAASRSRRVNAGDRMKEVMEQDDKDPFYAQLYGGFYDEATDEDYKCSMSKTSKKKTNEEDASDPNEEDASGPIEEKSKEEEGGSDEGPSDLDSEEEPDEADVEDEEDEEKRDEENGENEPKLINENGKSKPVKTIEIEEPSSKKLKLNEAES